MSDLTLNDMPYEATVLADDLVWGLAAAGWKGDPRLSLRVGVLTAAKNGYDPRSGKWYRKGELLARRYEVWRHLETGEDERIIDRPLHLLHEIIPALVKIDPRTPGFENSVDRVIRENDAVHAQRASDIREAHGEMVEHLWALAHDRSGPKNTFRGMPGSNPEKQL